MSVRFNLKEEVERLVKETIERQIKEQIKEHEEWFRQLGVTIKPPYSVMPEYIIFNQPVWVQAVKVAREDFENYFKPMYSDISYDMTLGSTITEEADSMTITAKERNYAIIGGLKNKGCYGKFQISYDGIDYVSFYIRKDESATIFRPLILRPEKTLRINSLDGHKPLFDPIGIVVISCYSSYRRDC